MKDNIIKNNQIENKEDNNKIIKENKKIISALEESENIINGKIDTKRYDNFDELVKDID